MLIKEFETFVVGNPPPRFGGRYFIFVKLVTDTGITGYGEVYCATFSAATVEAMLRDTAERYAVGHDPFRIETLWRRVYGAGYNLRPDVSLVSVLSALEMACWDIVGKACDKPAYELLGGKIHERLRTYTYLYPKSGDVYPDGDDPDHIYVNPHRAAERALDYVAMGFTAVKFDPAGPYTVFDGGMPSGQELERSV
ncbi:MAG: mandelate racemase/muconate lactonizing enzyme family protein, partial [Halieaceae bacterium]